LLPPEMLGDPNSAPEIKPWTKALTPVEIAVVAPPQLTEVPAPSSTKEKSSPPDLDLPNAPPPQTELKQADAPTDKTLLGPAVPQEREKPTVHNADPRVQLASAAAPSTGGGSPSFVGNLPPRYPEVAVENRNPIATSSSMRHSGASSNDPQVRRTHCSNSTVPGRNT
jgi:hypothetical protein